MMQMRTEGPILTRREGAVLEVTLDRPKANAIDITVCLKFMVSSLCARPRPSIESGIVWLASLRLSTSLCMGTWDPKYFR